MERDKKDSPIIRLPKKETVLAEQATIKIQKLLGFPNGELFSKVTQIIHKQAIDIYGKTN